MSDKDQPQKDQPQKAAVASRRLFAAGTNVRVNKAFFRVGDEVDPTLFRGSEEVAGLVRDGVLEYR